MTTHVLPLNRGTLHGHFDNALQPVLRIAAGDTVRFTLLDASWRYDPVAGIREPEFARDPILDRGHAMCGPIYIEGAHPGMALEIRIGELRPGRLGWTGTRFNERYGLTRLARLEWQIDGERGTASNQLGHTVVLSPFLGVMGNALAGPGVHTTTPRASRREHRLQGTGERDHAPPAHRGRGRAVQHRRRPRGAGRRRGERHGYRMPDGARRADV